jgi:hypothetical protein
MLKHWVWTLAKLSNRNRRVSPPLAEAGQFFGLA